MKLKSRWPLLTGLFGIVAVAIGVHWSHLEVLEYVRSKVGGVEVDGGVSLGILLMYDVAWALICFSFIALMEHKSLRKIAMWIIAVMIVPASCLIIFHTVENIAVPAQFIILFGNGVLLALVIASIVLTIDDWFKKKSKKLSIK